MPEQIVTSATWHRRPGISPETLRKIETVDFADPLVRHDRLPQRCARSALHDLAAAWRNDLSLEAVT